MQYDRTPFGQLETRRAQIAQQNENSARMAKSYAFWTTKGRGEKLIEKVFGFSVTFIEEPCFTYGASLDDDGIDPVDGHFPRCHGAVWQWRRDTDGYYTGAWLLFVVDTTAPSVLANTKEPSYTVHHHLAFEGIAIKGVPAYLLDNIG